MITKDFHSIKCFTLLFYYCYKSRDLKKDPKHFTRAYLHQDYIVQDLLNNVQQFKCSQIVGIKVNNHENCFVRKETM